MSYFDIYDEYLAFCEKLLEKPYIIIDPKQRVSVKNDMVQNIKSFHDQYIAFHNNASHFQEIPKMIIKNMDNEQIWAQINRSSSMIQKKFTKTLKSLQKQDEKSIEIEENNENLEENENLSEKDPLNASKNDTDIASIQVQAFSQSASQQNGEKPSKNIEKNDYEDLENFLEATENQQFNEIQEELYGEGNASEAEGSNFNSEEANSKEEIHYQDFYEDKSNENNDDIGENEDEEIEHGIFEEIREEELENGRKNQVSDKLDEEIERLQNKILDKKAWQLKGEVRSSQRPKNSLLEENLDFKSAVNLLENTASKEFSDSLEKIIQQRALDEAWDDVPEYIYQTKAIQENFANEEQLNFEKSSKGLADIYEEKFKKNILNLPVETEGDKTKVEIQELFKKICFSLDHLSNLSFVPKPDALKNAQISVKNVPSIKREEKIPIFISEQTQKGKKELFDQKNAVFQEKNEMTKEEKKQKHRKIKRNIRNKNKEKKRKEALQQLTVLGQTKFEYNQVKKSQAKIKKETKQKNTQSVKYTKSSQFFENLQSANNEKSRGEAKNSSSTKAKNAQKKLKI